MSSCGDCGYGSPKWFGRCPSCGSWEISTPAEAAQGLAAVAPIAAASAASRIRTTVDEFDRAIGGGFVAGQVLLLAGEPGIGKSTMVLQMLDGLAERNLDVLLVSGEESIDQISGRVARLDIDGSRLRAATATTASSIVAEIDRSHPDVVVVDSIQTLIDPSLSQAPGSPLQVQRCASLLVGAAKQGGTIVVLVGHVTKEGSVAGPKALEHIVDTVVIMSGDRGGRLRSLKVAKNRFGSTDEAGVMTMTPRGLVPIGDPSAAMLEGRRPDVPGSVVVAAMHGDRPLLAEIQALVIPRAAQPRRVVGGLDPKRVALLIGVLDRRCGIGLSSSEIFVAAAGGLGVREPACDLAICLALASAARGSLWPADLAVSGEVGLAGEIRSVPGLSKRAREAGRHGFRAIMSPASDEIPAGVDHVVARDVLAALEHLVPARAAHAAS